MKAVTKKYGSYRALEEVELRIPRNKITCIVGMNGSGKTTLLRLLTGQAGISSGFVSYKENRDGFYMTSDGFPSQSLTIGYCA